MRLRPAPVLGLTALALISAFAGCGDETRTASSGTTTGTPPLPAVDDIMTALPQSCAFDCSDCEEPVKPFDCPTTKPWDKVPHADACGSWDQTYPKPVQGKCSASDPTGEAARKAGPMPGGL